MILDFIRGLLNHAGSDINVQQLIEKIPNDLRIPGLPESLCKIMQDYNIQVPVARGERERVNEFSRDRLDVSIGMLSKDYRP